MKQMSKGEWKAFLGDRKYEILERLAGDMEALEALEDYLCHELKCDNTLYPGKAPSPDGNFFQSVILNNPADVNNDKLVNYLRSYAVALNMVQQSLAKLTNLKKEDERSGNSENPAI